MKKFILKSFFYVLLIFLALELVVRVFHLYFQYPVSTINERKVELYYPGQKGYFATGNRRMNLVQYRINDSGFNSYREYNPSQDSIEIAIVGDSFIEGFHQDYFNSLGAKIERRLSRHGAKVFEYGCSGYDLADQLNLISKYPEVFSQVEMVFIYLKFHEDLERSEFEPNYFRVNLDNLPTFKIKRKIKLLSYLDGIGLFLPVRNFVKSVKNEKPVEVSKEPEPKKMDSLIQERLGRFKVLMDHYPDIDRQKVVFLIDKTITPTSFIQFCDAWNYAYLDFGAPLNASEERTHLVYDQHWNDHGREIISEAIVNYIQNNTDFLED
ncbi:hypothetical protein [Flagellimonas sp.]|uniref:hypothetical protein n=1 Tax=Flagellimonas sp. TaxID=2058762 RepID=UPI003F4A61F7